MANGNAVTSSSFQLPATSAGGEYEHEPTNRTRSLSQGQDAHPRRHPTALQAAGDVPAGELAGLLQPGQGQPGVGSRRQHVLRHELQRHRRVHPGRGRSGGRGGRHRGGQGRLDVDAQPAGGGGAGRSAVRAAPLGRHGALRPLRRRGDGDGRAHRAHPQRPRPGGLLRLPRLARLVPGRQPGRGPRPGRPSPPRPRTRRRAACANGHGAAVPLQPCRGAGGDRRKTRQRDRRRW